MAFQLPKGIGPQGLGIKGNNGYHIGSPAKKKSFKPHKMYGKNGEVENAKTKEDHLELKEKGYGHSPAKKSAAWERKEGKNADGGLNQKGVDSYKKDNPGSNLQTAVTTPPSELKPGSKAAERRKSFCARMGGMAGPMKKPNGEPTRKALALRKWNC
jgi:hypothetical protein